MGMLKRWRDRLERRNASLTGDDDTAQTERYRFSAAIPVAGLGSICRIDLQLLREPQRDGERLHLRAHLQTNFGSVLRPALAQAASAEVLDAPRSASRSLAPADRAARLATRGLQRVLATPLAQRIGDSLATHDFNTWVEVQASTEPLNDGAHSLVPQQDKLAAMGIVAARGSGPQNWITRSAQGFAQLSLLQLDKSDLPPELSRRFGDQPFQLAAAIVNTAERK